MENILVVIRDEIRENRKVLEEIRDILRDRQGRGVREMHKQNPDNRSHTEKAIEAVKSDGSDKIR